MDFYKVTFSFPWTKQILFDESETDGIKISEQCNDIIWLSSMVTAQSALWPEVGLRSQQAHTVTGTLSQFYNPAREIFTLRLLSVDTIITLLSSGTGLNPVG